MPKILEWRFVCLSYKARPCGKNHLDFQIFNIHKIQIINFLHPFKKISLIRFVFLPAAVLKEEQLGDLGHGRAVGIVEAVKERGRRLALAAAEPANQRGHRGPQALLLERKGFR